MLTDFWEACWKAHLTSFSCIGLPEHCLFDFTFTHRSSWTLPVWLRFRTQVFMNTARCLRLHAQVSYEHCLFDFAFVHKSLMNTACLTSLSRTGLYKHCLFDFTFTHRSLWTLPVWLHFHAQVFMNTATVGASADVGKMTSSAIKKILGPAAFLITGVLMCAGTLHEVPFATTSTLPCCRKIYKNAGHFYLTNRFIT